MLFVLSFLKLREKKSKTINIKMKTFACQYFIFLCNREILKCIQIKHIINLLYPAGDEFCRLLKTFAN